MHDVWHSLQRTDEEKCVPVCSMYTDSTVLRRLHHRHSGVILCNPNSMCSSFTQNNTKQLQGNSAQSTDKEPQVGSSGGKRSAPFRPLKRPLWDYNDNVLGSLLSPCLDPSASPQHNSILQYLIHLQHTIFNWIQCGALTTIFFNAIWWLLFSYGLTLQGKVVQPCTPASTLLRLCGWDIAHSRFLLSRKIIGWKYPSSTLAYQNINISPLRFPALS